MIWKIYFEKDKCKQLSLHKGVNSFLGLKKNLPKETICSKLFKNLSDLLSGIT